MYRDQLYLKLTLNCASSAFLLIILTFVNLLFFGISHKLDFRSADKNLPRCYIVILLSRNIFVRCMYAAC